jgi:hypothetical protein
MKSIIIPIILFFVGIYGLGEFRITFAPFKAEIERPYNLLGMFLIALGIVAFQHQAEQDTKKAFIKIIQEEIEKQVETDLKTM